MREFSAEPYLGKWATHIPISNSEIQVFRDCPRKWYLQYYLGYGMKKKKVLGPLALGSRVHNSLEKFYRDGVLVEDSYEEALELDRQKFLEDGDDQDPELEKKFWDEADLGRIMLEGYLEWVDENNLDYNLETIGVEKQLTVPMFNDRIILQGKIDRKVRNLDNGHISILDYKTAQSFATYDKTYNQSEQIRMYVLLDLLSGDKNPIDGGIYRVLRKVKRTRTMKNPAYKEYYVQISRTDIETYYKKLANILSKMLETRDRLDAGENHLDVVWANFNENCSWKCPFYKSCPLMDDGSDFEGYVESYCEVIDPYERYKEESTI